MIEQNQLPEKPEIAAPKVQAKEEFPTDAELDEDDDNLLKPVIKQWLENHKVEEYVDLISKYPDFQSPSMLSARTSLIDANSDGQKELAIQTGCAPVGNCGFLLLEKNGTRYRTLLETEMVQRYQLRKTKTNGYFDLETSAHGGATEGGIVRYKFNGKDTKPINAFCMNTK